MLQALLLVEHMSVQLALLMLHIPIGLIVCRSFIRTLSVKQSFEDSRIGDLVELSCFNNIS